MASEPKTKPPRLSPEEVQDILHEMAREGDGAERRFAVKMLSVGDAAITLPTPLTQEEINLRIGRQLRAVGEENSRKAYGWAFPHGVPKSWSLARVRGKLYLPTTVDELYEMFSEAPKDPLTGAPPGYPTKGTILKKRRWISDYAMKLNEERRRNEPRSEEGTDAEEPRPELG